ncbi:MAG TPA: PIN domain-containing protein [Myxococcota bacterium]|nr:PIN domain-containing protein [Myxococcota bacterium]
MKNFLKKHSRISIDTSIFIYFVERHPRYHSLCEPIFKAIESGKIEAFTSTVSLLEILVQPYRRKLDDLALKFYSLFVTYPNLNWVNLTIGIADKAARLRAEYSLKTPDAVQLASAFSSDATGFICNDLSFKKVREMNCLILEDHVQSDKTRLHTG